MNDNYKYGQMDGWHGDEHFIEFEIDDDYYDEYEGEKNEYN